MTDTRPSGRRRSALRALRASDYLSPPPAAARARPPRRAGQRSLRVRRSVQSKLNSKSPTGLQTPQG